MNHRFTNPEEVEQWLRSSKPAIQPSADLRSNILNAALEQQHDRSADQRLSFRIVMIFCLLFATATFAQYAYSRWSQEVGINTDRHVYSLSEKLRREQGLQSEASFAEAFWRTRQDVAGRLRGSDK
jgi:hypothetical protein